MRKRIRTAMKTTVRSAFKTVRLIRKYQSLNRDKVKDSKPPGFFLALETGTFTNYAGCGSMFDSFLQNGQLGNHSGEDQEPLTPDEKNYWKSKLRILPFDHTFTFLPIDVNKRKDILFQLS